MLCGAVDIKKFAAFESTKILADIRNLTPLQPNIPEELNFHSV